jgi:hypothetical protein
MICSGSVSLPALLPPPEGLRSRTRCGPGGSRYLFGRQQVDGTRSRKAVIGQDQVSVLSCQVWSTPHSTEVICTQDPSSETRAPSSVIGPRSSVLGPPSSVIGHRSESSVLGPRSSVIGPRSSVLGHRSSVLGPPSSVRRHRSSVIGPSLLSDAELPENIFQ